MRPQPELMESFQGISQQNSVNHVLKSINFFQLSSISLVINKKAVPFFYKTIIAHGIFALLKIFFVLFGGTSLFSEEAQYWLWSKYPDLSYYSKPPLISWVNYVMTNIFGDSEISVRISAILCGFFIGILIYRLALQMFGSEQKAFWSSVLLIAFPYFWIVSFFFTTDSLVTLFWIWALYSLYRASHDEPIYWIWTGIAVGMGLISKYVMVFFWPLAIVYLFLYCRNEFRNPYLYLSIFLSLVFLLPIVYWNYVHDWVTVKHVWSLAGGGESSATSTLADNAKYLLEFLGGQLGTWLIIFPLVILHGFRRFLKGDLRQQEFLIILSVLPIVAFFLLLSLQTSVEVNWTFFALPAIIIYVAHNYSGTGFPYRNRLGVVATLMVLFLSIPIVVQFTDLPAKYNPLRRIMGWETMVDDLQIKLNGISEPYQIVADSYHTASMLSFYLPDDIQIYTFSPEKRMNQFDLWTKEYGIEDENIVTVFIGKKMPDEKYEQDVFGQALEESKLLIPYNSSEGQEMHLVVYEKFENLPLQVNQTY